MSQLAGRTPVHACRNKTVFCPLTISGGGDWNGTEKRPSKSELLLKRFQDNITKKTCLFSTFCGNWLLFTPLKGKENEKAWRVNRNELCLLSCTGDRELRSFFLRTQLRALRGRRFRKEILSCPFGFWLCHKSSARQTAFISESLFSHIHMKMVQQDEHWHLFQHQKSWLGIICPQKVIFATTIHQD